MTDEERRAKAAADKRAYRLRKKQEDLARQAPKEEQERLFNEQFRNLSPEEIEARNRNDHHAQLTLGEKCLLDRQLQTPTAEQREKMASQIAQANGIIITEKDNIHDLEKQFKDASMREPQPILPTPRDRAKAILAEAEERSRRVELIMAQYQKDAANTNALLWHILETLILMRLELTDMIGGR